MLSIMLRIAVFFWNLSLETREFGESVAMEGRVSQGQLARLCAFEEEANIHFIRHDDPAVHLESFATD